MAHFAKIDSDNIVTQVIRIDDQQESRGIEHIKEDLKLSGTWIQTSYNTIGGNHKKGGTPLRKNYALIGSYYDAERDAFIPPKRFLSWILNEETCNWMAPVPYPKETGKRYKWDESIVNWVEEITE
jgi:hypothetical protein